ncbi:hypothetical protein CASFOL_036894 [Castilleja foliolosa]|uniref:PGG domain-containing protein n=1 Tax=Castilleja foliolosa TaxID=1961234 RepID=A0ABD3BQ45_9LAMI
MKNVRETVEVTPLVEFPPNEVEIVEITDEPATMAADEAVVIGINEEPAVPSGFRPVSSWRRLTSYLRYDPSKDTPSEARSTLLVFATLIAAATHGAILVSPAGLQSQDLAHLDKKLTWYSIALSKAVAVYGIFLAANSFSFFMSIYTMFFVVSSFPKQFEMRLMLVGWTITYCTSAVLLLPGGALITYIFIPIFVVTPVIALVLAKLGDCM